MTIAWTTAIVDKLLNETQEKLIGDNETLKTITKLTAVIAVNINRFILSPYFVIYAHVFRARRKSIVNFLSLAGNMSALPIWGTKIHGYLNSSHVCDHLLESTGNYLVVSTNCRALRVNHGRLWVPLMSAVIGEATFQSVVLGAVEIPGSPLSNAALLPRQAKNILSLFKSNNGK